MANKQEQQEQEELIAYSHMDPTIESVSDLIAKNPLFKNIQETDLLGIKGPDGKTNKELIEEEYNKEQTEEDKKEKWPLLKVGTVLYLNPDMVTRDFLPVESTGQIKEFTTWGQYQTETQKFLSSLKGYSPAYSLKGGSTKKFDALVKYTNPFFRVWIYSKTLNAVFNATPYCFSVSTNTQINNGDSFSINLVAMKAEKDNASLPSLSVENVVINTDAFSKDLSCFMLNVSENDIVFISFEQLDCEPALYGYGEMAAEVDTSQLASKYYDFIGLVGNVSSSSTATGFGTITITGSSIEKLFQDDEAIFRPLSVLTDSLYGELLIGDRKKRGFVQRQFVDGTFQSLFTSTFRTIERTLKFFLNTVSNVGLVPINDNGSENFDLFSSWGTDRTRLFKVTADEKGKVREVLGTEYAKGLYQIVKLSVDPELNKRHLSDASVSNPEGTVMSLLQSVCAPYLTELILDTYKNTFDIIVRTPPFSKKAILDWLNAEDVNVNSWSNINIEDVEAENLSWETNFFTWYEINPQGNIIPIDGLISLCWIPTLFLSEFIEVWGSRKLSIVSPYTVIGSSDEDTQAEIEQTIHDLVWLVQSNFYLPFTRRGTITLKTGDRRIKKGQWIRYQKTGEIFYVESVQQIASVSATSVERSTVLQVSRGLVEKYVRDETKGYFNIIDFDVLARSLHGFGKERKNKTSTDAPVDRNLFSFFLQRKQFIK